MSRGAAVSGFAYQLGFVQVFQRFPVQQPLEICEELQSFIALQTALMLSYLFGTATPVPHPARAAESRAVASLSAGCLLRKPRPDQRS